MSQRVGLSMTFFFIVYLISIIFDKIDTDKILFLLNYWISLFLLSYQI
jgi:hypothetical protein